MLILILGVQWSADAADLETVNMFDYFHYGLNAQQWTLLIINVSSSMLSYANSLFRLE